MTDPDAVTSVGGVSYTYDANGNLTNAGASLTNTWNYNNRLTQEVTNGVTSTFTYDYAGQRVKYATGSNTTYYPSKYFNITGSNQTKHIFANGVEVASITGTGSGAQAYVIATDQLTGANAIAPVIGGGLAEAIDYYPFGSQRFDEQLGISTYQEQRQFAGSEFDPSTQLNYMNARYENGAIGRWLSKDPAVLDIGKYNPDKFQSTFDQLKIITDPQSLNAYSYVTDNPITRTDPDGKIAISLPSFGFGDSIIGDIFVGVSPRVIPILGSVIQLFWPTRLSDDSLTDQQKISISKEDSGQKDKAESPTKGWTDKIGRGHAFPKHKDEFPNVKTPEDLSKEAEKVVNDPDSIVKEGAKGRTAYGDPKSGTVVVHNPADPDQGTIFKPDKGPARWIKENFK